MDFLDNTHQLSLSWLLGKPKQAAPIIIDRIVHPEPKVLSDNEQAALDAKQLAHSYFQKSILDSALHYYLISNELDPTDLEAERMIAAINTALKAEIENSKHDSIMTQEQCTGRYYQQANDFYRQKL